MSILDIAADITGQTVFKSSDDISRSIFIVGSKFVGKSSLIHNFLEKQDTVKETLVLEYSYGRKLIPQQGMEKSICHIWEYGGRHQMLYIVLKSITTNNNFNFVIMLDLSKVKSIWNVLETCIKCLTEKFKPELPSVVIIGGKYDLFKYYDSEMKKLICVTLRSIALLYNAHLVFHSMTDPLLLKKTKELLHCLGFGIGPGLKEKNTNYNKPLIIPRGTDTWENIGCSPSTFDEVRSRFLSRITSENEEIPEVKTLQRTQPEPVLDAMVALKYDELRRIETFDSTIEEYLDFLHH